MANDYLQFTFKSKARKKMNPYINPNKSGIQCESLLQRQKKGNVIRKPVVKVVNVHVHKPSCTTTDVYMVETSNCTIYKAETMALIRFATLFL